MARDSLNINDVTYEHDSNQQYEFFCHLDAFAVLWQVSRNLHGADARHWQASVHQLKYESLDLILLRGDEPQELLTGLSELIKLAAWLRQEAHHDDRPAPLVTVQAVEGTRLTLGVRCQGCNKTEDIKVEATDYLLFLQKSATVQELFPYLSSSQGKLLLRCICADCWIGIFEGQQTGDEGNEGSL